ncbi:MAG: DEAD/DEAH box helicase [Saprospiraceae bacterium]|nr:DEAD/DEAH box helicase [Saprospiraceae bacterium]
MRKHNPEFGSTWWGQAWLRSLEGIDDDNRLPRGRAYARQGMVESIEFDEHLIEARVAGSRPRPYKVSIGVRRFSERQIDKLIDTIIDRHDLVSALVSGAVPVELDALSQQLKMPLFPDSWKDLSMQCSCPDWAVPCKHLAAVLYLVAREIDLDPFLVFRLHGVDLEEEFLEWGLMDEDQEIIEVLSLYDLTQELSEQESFPEVHPVEPDFHSLPQPSLRFYECLSPSPGFYPAGDFRQYLIRYVQSAIKSAALPLAERDGDSGPVDLRKVEFVELSINDRCHVEAVWLYLPDNEEVQISRLDEALYFLIAFPDRYLSQVSDDVRLLIHTARLARQMIAAGMFWPRILDAGLDTWCLMWWPVDWMEEWEPVLTEGREMVREGLLTLVWRDEPVAIVVEHRFDFLLALCITSLIHAESTPPGKSVSHSVDQLFFNHNILIQDGYTGRGLAGAIHQWLSRIRLASSTYKPVVIIEIDQQKRFTASVQAGEGAGQYAPMISVEEFMVGDQYLLDRLAFLRTLDMLISFNPSLADAIATGQSVIIAEEDMWEFFNTLQLLSEWLDLSVLLPEEWKGLLKPVVGFRADLMPDDSAAPGLLNLGDLLDFQWQLTLGDHQISLEEFRQLYNHGSSVIRVRDQYILLEPSAMSALLDSMHEAKRPTGMDLLRHILAEDFDGGPVIMGDRLREEIGRRLSIPEIPVPDGLHATLRPYQERGFRWLYRNVHLAHGAIIADDMGLGKTIQIITLMLVLKDEHPERSPRMLVVAPTTLLGNWQREIERFAPGLSVHIYHGTGRKDELASDVVLTTYGTLRSAKSALLQQEWDLAVIDEAQAIKNAKVAQTKAVKALKSRARIAMTGTPVENRLSDYWSIFDFVLPGYLGSLSWFDQHLGRPIQQMHDRERLDRFRRMVDPFVLRRMKTDRTIVPDLPDKIETNQYCDLTPEQAALYQARTDSLNQILAMDDRFQRGGLLFKLLVQLKQVCNHPAQFQKQTVADPTRSGKAARLLELVDEITEQGEQCIIFTQFKEMALLLEQMLQKERGIRALMIHGGVSRKQRDETVNRFQYIRNHPVMIITIKAGGAGLNLTAASHVIHYDLWWNPAVEAQATDRSYRIGQDKHVMVHRLICRNTLEEKIDRLIQAKKHLADLTVAKGEQWIGDLSPEEIQKVIRLEA